MEILVAFAAKVVEFTVVPVGRQFGYVLFYRSNIKGLKEQADKLKATRKDVEDLVLAAQNNNEEIRETVRDWMRRVDEITKQSDKFYEDDSHANISCSRGSCLNLWLRHQISRKAKKMAAEVDQLKGEGNFDEVSSCQTLPQCTGLPQVGKEAFESRISTSHQIMEALADTAVHVVGLYGLGGVGKTTLARQVASKAQEEKVFDKVVLAEVKHNPLKEIQSQIADMVGLKFDMQSESELLRASHLRQRLEQEKSLLVVLDDLWERLDLGQVGIPFITEGRRCKVLLTSRSEDLLSSQMNCKRNIMVGLLSKEEAWGLFKEMAEINDDSEDPDLLSIAVEVSQKCAQLPLAIVTVARALRNKRSLVEWKDASRRLKSYTSRNITGTKEVDSSLKLSYDYLESKELKSTFLLSAMFSQDPLTLDLFMYSVGLGLLQDVHRMEEARDRLHTMVRQLKASSLLLDSYSEDRFTMHDVVRDVALSFAFEEQHALVLRHREVDEWPDEDQLESCTTICLDGSNISEPPKELNGPRVEFFFLNSTNPDLRITSSFFKGMQELKVLNLGNMTFSSLPFSISLLKKLRTLSLHFCTLEDITVVEHLKKLRILNLSYSRIKRLPIEVGQLSCLQMLNLNYCHELEVIPPNILSNLIKLEVLYMKGSFDQWEAEGLNKSKERASLAELKQLQKLSTLEIDISDASVLPNDLFLENSLERYRISVRKSWFNSFMINESSRTLILELNDSINVEYGIFRLLESVENLYLENLTGTTSLYQGQLTSPSFCKLRVIKVRSCDQLKSLFPISKVGTLSRLVEIEISECMSMEEIVSFVNQENIEKGPAMSVIEFIQLRSLTLTYMPALTGFCFGEETSLSNKACNARTDTDNSTPYPLFSNQVAFPNLETLYLESINFQYIWEIPTSTSSVTQNSEIVEDSHIRTIWNDQLADRSFRNLKTLVVKKCDFLLNLVPLHLLKSLNNLKELTISDCVSLEAVFDFEESNNYKETLAFHLKRLKLFTLPKLKTVWGRGCPGFVSNSLEEVTIDGCRSLKSIFPASIAISLTQLQKLEINSCAVEGLVAKDEVPSESTASFVFPELTELRLAFLPNLKNFYPQSHTSEWPLLRHLDICCCNELELFRPELSGSLDTKYPLFMDEKVIPQLEVLTLNEKHAGMIWKGHFRAYLFPKVKVVTLTGISGKAGTFPYGFLNGFPNLEQLHVNSSSFEVMFGCPDQTVDDDARKAAPLKQLKLGTLYELKYLSNENCQLDLILQNLESLEVSFCYELINLGPSLASLENLTDLDVTHCHGLINLMTTSIARTLVRLTSLRIRGCNQIEEIINNDVKDVEKEIGFKKLKSLKLDNLPSCKSFCCHSYTFMFPSLDDVIITGCPRLAMFCPGVLKTPSLKGVKVKNDEIYWNSDLNRTIQRLFAAKVGFPGTDVKICEYPELIDIWSGKLLDCSFSFLTSLIVDRCDFLPNHVIPSYVLTSLINLEKLEVRNCDLVEVVFDLEGINIDKEVHTLQAIRLKYLRLDYLPNLKYVWNKDPHIINCFQYVEHVIAYDCESLTSIFPAFIAKGLTKLQWMSIKSCGVEVIVAEDKNPGSDSNFVFPRLNSIELCYLPNLKNFYPQRYTVEWPNLCRIEVINCRNVKVFGFQVQSITGTHELHAIENQYPLFLAEKVVPKLVDLVLNQNDVSMMRKFQADLFRKVQFLCLDNFNDDPIVFPYTFLERFRGLNALSVFHSSFKEIFPFLAPRSDSSIEIPLLDFLKLVALDHLLNIWNQDSQIYPTLQNLKYLIVRDCSRLINLAPSSASFDSLTCLEVCDCHRLSYLLTTSIARSLVSLKELEIVYCNIIEQTVINEGECVEDKIALKNLKRLKLIDLPALKSFCAHTCTFEFPSLEEVTVIGCPKMKMFCGGFLDTPLLEGVKVEENEERWEGDLNKTLQQIFLEKGCQNSSEG